MKNPSGVNTDFGDMFYWGGIDSITDSFDHRVTDWTLLSLNNIDWSTPSPVAETPEPATACRIATAIAAIALVNRRRFRPAVNPFRTRP